MTPYKEKLKDPRWQRRRLEILNRDNFTCQLCLDSRTEVHVHHFRYRFNTDPWDYPDIDLITLCKFCHKGHGHFLSGDECIRRKLIRQKELEEIGVDKEEINRLLKVYCEQIDYFWIGNAE